MHESKSNKPNDRPRKIYPAYERRKIANEMQNNDKTKASVLSQLLFPYKNKKNILSLSDWLHTYASTYLLKYNSLLQQHSIE